MTIMIHIDELILHGFAPGDRGRIAQRLASELERLIAAHGLPVGLLAEHGAAAIDGGGFLVPPGARPELVGAIIARSIYGAPATGRTIVSPPTPGGS
jgi:hypothetical protein